MKQISLYKKESMRDFIIGFLSAFVGAIYGFFLGAMFLTNPMRDFERFVVGFSSYFPILLSVLVLVGIAVIHLALWKISSEQTRTIITVSFFITYGISLTWFSFYAWNNTFF